MFKWNDSENKSIKQIDGQARTFPVEHRFYEELVQPWLDEGNTVEPYKTPEELEQERLAKIQANKTALFNACESYEISWVDRNMQSEFDLSRALYEAGTTTPTDLPKAATVGEWKESLWADYYTRKAAVEAEQEFSLDFSNHYPLQFNFHDLKNEREDFLGGQ